MPTGDPVFTGGTFGGFHCGVASAAPFLFGDELIAKPLRVNDQIRIRSVRVIDENGRQLGILATEDAMARARTAGLDLIEVSPNAQPPVCKIADYGRLKYEQSKKDKDARKKQRHFELKEVKLRPKIETHDYETKARMAERLLLDGSKIKVTIMFRGREITYTAFGRRLLDRMAEDMSPLAIVEREAKLEGKNMFMILAPRATPTGPPKFSTVKEQAIAKDSDPSGDRETREGDGDGQSDASASVRRLRPHSEQEVAQAQTEVS